MPFVSRRSLSWLGLLAFLGAASVAGFVWSGIYDVGADDLHTRPVHSLLETLREQSIERRARAIVVPDLDDPALVRQGAGNYAAMCAGCHRAPGIGDTELSRGLYPAPAALAERPAGDPARQFWVIKHGIKASGMPAWGRSMEDEYIWGLVALLQKLPDLGADEYAALVAASGGHAHGGGETPAAAASAPAHAHAPGTPPHDDAPAAPQMRTHRHADGTVEAHPVPAQPADAPDAHNDDHQH